MRIRIPNLLILNYLLAIALLFVVIFAPTSPVRVVLALPFLLLSPGYALVKALFVKNELPDRVAVLAISAALSIALVAFTGFAMNFTQWGIRLEPILSATIAFVVVISNIALLRQYLSGSGAAILIDLRINLDSWREEDYGRSLTMILLVGVIAAVGFLGYAVLAPKTGESFSEFYLLGSTGKALSYPSDFVLNQGRIASIRYGNGPFLTGDDWGRVTVGIVNHEKEPISYFLSLTIDGQPAKFNYNGQIVNRLGPTPLDVGAKAEIMIGFAPSHPGDNQEVDFLFYRDQQTIASETLRLLINATSRS